MATKANLAPTEVELTFYAGAIPPLTIRMPDDVSAATITFSFFNSPGDETAVLTWDSDDISVSTTDVAITGSMSLTPGVYWFEYSVDSVHKLVGPAIVSYRGNIG